MTDKTRNTGPATRRAEDLVRDVGRIADALERLNVDRISIAMERFLKFLEQAKREG